MIILSDKDAALYYNCFPNHRQENVENTNSNLSYHQVEMNNEFTKFDISVSHWYHFDRENRFEKYTYKYRSETSNRRFVHIHK